ncbi:MAG TPA: hypothetical protein VHV75_12920 [Solirubrobacteraceae bacterium]|nr:hypothetical protein [Solirubrobacteraceae bacterium]
MSGAFFAVLNTRGNLTVGAATTGVMIDYPNASIVDRNALNADVSTLQDRAELYANLLTTPPVLADVAKHLGVPAGEISGLARVTANIPHSLFQPRSEERASQIVDSLAPYRLELESNPDLPILTIYASAPSAPGAIRLANSAVLGLRDYLRTVAQQEHFPQQDLPQVRQLGDARGGVTNKKARYTIGFLTFVTAFALMFTVLFLLLRRPRIRRPEHLPGAELRSRLTSSAAADWPRTTRILPWSVALLIGIVWLTPFDKIQLAVSAPVNITLDRIVLPFVALIWLIARASVPGARPRVRGSIVHLALGLYVACAFLSVVLDAHYINQTGDISIAIKKLPLLLSYASVFLIVASSIRPGEVPAFMKYSLGLAVLFAAEIIFEYHFKENLFNVWFSKLPSPFEFSAPTTDGLDSLGRLWIEGSSDYGVEAILMMTLVLPVAVIGVLDSKTLRRKALYGMATAILVVAMFATERKSALVVPSAAMLVLLYYRRSQLLKLSPLFLVLLVMVPVLAPGAIHGVLSQVTTPGGTHVATVSDRTADYDAIRPDLWSHLLFGRGYGSFDPATYRVLDSAILSPLVDTGVFGLLAYLSIGTSLVVFARKIARRPEDERSMVAQTAVAGGVCLLVCSTLYDLLGFPHGPYTFFYVAGLAVAGLGSRAQPAPQEPRRPRLDLTGLSRATLLAPPPPQQETVPAR